MLKAYRMNHGKFLGDIVYIFKDGKEVGYKSPLTDITGQCSIFPNGREWSKEFLDKLVPTSFITFTR